MIELGLKARDKITGFEGVITGRAQYLTGCDQYVLVPPVKDGQVQKSEWFDEGGRGWSEAWWASARRSSVRHLPISQASCPVSRAFFDGMRRSLAS